MSSKEMPPESQRPLPIAVLRAIARFVVGVAVVIYTLLDELLFPLFRPLVAWLSGLKLFELLGALIQRLPPYGVLVLLAVPFALIEPVKIYALILGASGHVIQGTLLLLVAQVLSIFTCDRLYHTGHAQLMQIDWFRRLMTWLKGLRDIALNWGRATPVWIGAVRMGRAVRAWIVRVIHSVRS